MTHNSLSFPPFPHGGDPTAVARSLGLSSTTPIRLDFSVNLNPLGPPPALNRILSSGSDLVSRYPSATAHTAASALADAHHLPHDTILVGNGSTEIFFWIAHVLASNAGWIAPTYSGYEEACRAAGIPARSWAVRPPDTAYADALASLDPLPGSVLFLGNPDNPSGQTIPSNAILNLAARAPQAWIAVDESFVDFLADSAAVSLLRPGLPPNIIVVKSLTKYFAIPGLRLGMAHAHPDTCARLRRAQLPWNVNALAQAAATVLYADGAYLTRTRQETTRLRDTLAQGLQHLGWQVFPSAANYLLARLPPPWTASELQKALLPQGILIRSCQNFFGLGNEYARLAVRPEPEIKELLAVLAHLSPSNTTSPAPSTREPPPAGAARSGASRTPAIMVVGTTSHAGKSIVTAGLCRLFSRQGIRVAPFKAQNMALNSFVTPEGGEMGRAQVMQARAAGIPPHTDMNPVLLKPTGNRNSQVIVNGSPVGVMNAQTYYGMKQSMKDAARAAYDRLSARFDLVILEGAGSPAEINLMEEDFVNMAMAEYADARVLLVADIDRGGVFASIYGTISLLPPAHRRLLAGVIINKFRGDKSLLDTGIRQIEQLTGIPVLGVLPFVSDLLVDEEDSLGIESRPARPGAVLDIAVIRLPHISNYTDFLPLDQTPAVSLRYVEAPAELGNPDLILLPGTKHTRGDLDHLYQSGMADAVVAAVRRRIPVFGICGGYQMLGTLVADPDGVEGSAGETKGLGLLDVSTILTAAKELAQVRGSTLHTLPFAKCGTRLSGYEIHAGRTTPAEAPAIAITFRRDTPVLETDGAVANDGLVAGCYMHGLFDEAGFRSQFIQWLLERKGITAPPPEHSPSPPDPFDTLADLLATHLDSRTIVALARRGPSA